MDFIIEFEALAMKVDTDELHAIFFIKEERITRHYQNNIGIPTYGNARDLERVEGGNNVSRTGIQVNGRMPQLQDKYGNHIW